MEIRTFGLTCAVLVLLVSFSNGQNWFRDFNFHSPMNFRPQMRRETINMAPQPLPAPRHTVYSPFRPQGAPIPAVVSRARSPARAPEVRVAPSIMSSRRFRNNIPMVKVSTSQRITLPFARGAHLPAPRVMQRQAPVIRTRPAPQIQIVQRPQRPNPVSHFNAPTSGWGLGGIMGGGRGAGGMPGSGGALMAAGLGWGGWDVASDIMDTRYDVVSDRMDSYGDFASDVYDSYSDRYDFS